MPILDVVHEIQCFCMWFWQKPSAIFSWELRYKNEPKVLLQVLLIIHKLYITVSQYSQVHKRCLSLIECFYIFFSKVWSSIQVSECLDCLQKTWRSRHFLKSIVVEIFQWWFYCKNTEWIWNYTLLKHIRYSSVEVRYTNHKKKCSKFDGAINKYWMWVSNTLYSILIQIKWKQDRIWEILYVKDSLPVGRRWCCPSFSWSIENSHHMKT